jgi:hypothetical protein
LCSGNGSVSGVSSSFGCLSSSQLGCSSGCSGSTCSKRESPSSINIYIKQLFNNIYKANRILPARYLNNCWPPMKF